MPDNIPLPPVGTYISVIFGCLSNNSEAMVA